MGRKYRNEPGDLVIDNIQPIQHSVSQVKIPSFKKITHRVKIGKHYDGSPHYANAEIITNRATPKDMDIVKIDEVTIQMLNQCPNCEIEGRPRIDKKSNKLNYHYQVDTKLKKNPSNRPDEYRLLYFHKDKTKPCIVANFDENCGIFTKKGKVYNKILKYIFPYYVKEKQQELIVFDSFQKLFNTIHL